MFYCTYINNYSGAANYANNNFATARYKINSYCVLYIECFYVLVYQTPLITEEMTIVNNNDE